MLQPGEEFPSEASASMSSDIAAKTSGSKVPSELVGLAPSTIAGVVLGVLGMCCVILAILLTLYLRCRGQKRGKKAETPMPSSSCQTTTTTRNMVPEQIHNHVSCQIPDQAVNKIPGQVLCMSPCSPGSSYGFLPPPSSPHGQFPVEICSNCIHELSVSDSKDLRTPG